MHEHSLMQDLFKKIQTIAHTSQATQVTKVTIQLGALSHISPEHFREHFDEMRANSLAENAALIVTQSTDIHAPDAQDIKLLSVEIAEDPL